MWAGGYERDGRHTIMVMISQERSRPDRQLVHIVPTTFMKMPWLLKLRSVRSSEKLVKL